MGWIVFIGKSRPSDNCGHPDSEILMGGGGRGGYCGGVKKVFFSALRASVWSKNKEGREGGEGPPPQDPPLVLSNICTTGARPGLLGKEKKKIFFR